MPAPIKREAIYIVLDIGSHMSSPSSEGSSLSCFEQSIQIIDLLIQRKIFQEYKGAIGLMIANSSQTANALYSSQAGTSSDFQYISSAQPLSLINWDILKYLRTKVHLTDVSSVDMVDALVITSHHLRQEVALLEANHSIRRVLVFSNFESSKSISKYEQSQIDDICGALAKQNISVDVICPAKLERDVDRNAIINPIVNIIQKITQRLEGSFYAYSEAAEALSNFEGRTVRPPNVVLTFRRGLLCALK
ncbi:hypothetical protein ACOME3_002581 [Neoechinorhynchus agilis]